MAQAAMAVSPNSITEFYEADHDRLDDLFKQFQAKKRVDFGLAKPYFREFLFGLQRHIVWEEDILFPIFEEKTGMRGGGPTEVMRMEHRQIRDHLDAIHEKVRQRDPDSDAEEAALLEVLGGHNQKEEHILYPAIDQHLSESEKADVFRVMKSLPPERYETCCGGHHAH